MKVLNLAVLAALFLSAPTHADQAPAVKPKLITYDWIPGRTMDEMARMMPDIDSCWNQITFETRFRHVTLENGKNAGILGWRERLKGSFLLGTVHFDAPEGSPVSAGDRPSEDAIGG